MRGILLSMALLAQAGPAAAQPAFSCAGFALLGGAQLICSHLDQDAPPQTCTYSWSLMATSGPTIVTGAFVLPPGTTNETVYQGSGFSYALTSPIVLCNGRQRASGS